MSQTANEPAMAVQGTMCAQKPWYKPMATQLLAEIRAWYQDPEHEKEFQAWLRAREAENRGACAV